MKNELRVVPLPAAAELHSGSFSLNGETKICIPEELASLLMIPAAEEMGKTESAGILQREELSSMGELIENWLTPLREHAGLPLTVSKDSPGDNTLTLIKSSVEADRKKPKTLEAYTLTVSPRGITIEAAAAPGFYYALQTLIQLCDDEGNIRSCRIEDEPGFSWRGLHLDCGRFYQSMDEIKLFLDLMALQKMNILHWHLTEDQGWRLEIKGYPRLTEIGSKRKETVWGHISKGGKVDDGVPHEGYYSHEDVKEIVAYARNRGIMVVPEIDLPGHSRAAIAAYPELGVFGKPMEVFTKWGVCKDIYNPEESTISFIENLMEEVLLLFPSPWIHIGGDEAVKDQWKKSERVKELLGERNLKDNHEMQSWFIKRIDAFLGSRGRKTIGWDEIMEGGAPENAVIMAWRHEKHGISAARQGLPVLMCPCQWTYLDYREERSSYEPLTISSVNEPWKKNNLEHFYAWNPLPGGMSEEEKKLVMGGQGQVWTEYIPEASMLHYMTWPRASALAEVLWSPSEKRDFPDFKGRLDSVLQIMDRRSVGYHFQEDLIPGGSLEKGDSQWKEQKVRIEKDGQGGRLQVLLKRKGFNNYSQISEVSLETPDGKVFRDEHTGYCGSFNRLNVYTLGDGSPLSLKGSVLTIRSRACSKVPEKPTGAVKKSRLQWAYKVK